MEIHFQQQPDTDSLNYTMTIPLPSKKSSKFKGRNRANGNNSNKYVGVRQRPSGRWVAEIKDTTQKIRMWLGTFQTAEEAARAYDEAACLLRGKNTKTNFVAPFVSHDSPLASRINNILNKRKNNSSSPKQQHKPKASTCSNSTTTSCNDHNSSSQSCTTTSSPSFSYASSEEKAQDGVLFDDAYKPVFIDDHQQSSLSSWRKFQLQVLQGGFEFDHHILELPKIEPTEEFSEFERMKVERQISASLYAMNGVHEYMETVCDPFWDLPPF